MCFHYALSADAQTLKNRFQAGFPPVSDNEEHLSPQFHANGFLHPHMPVITDKNPGTISLFKWGLIPSWVKTDTDAKKLKRMTLNARSETVFEKPSFRSSVRNNRCLVPADGFYEWMTYKGRKYPHFIYLKNRPLFSMAGIWSLWRSPETGKQISTYSILTTKANDFVERIHNVKKRMPVILPREAEQTWLDRDLTPPQISAFLTPCDSDMMDAHTISKLITSRDESAYSKEVQEPFDYPELGLFH